MAQITVINIKSAMTALEGESSLPLDVEKTSLGKGFKVGG